MDEKSNPEKGDNEFLMPGFRFHPTDEELVGFYLRRKLQQRPLPIELIKQVDIYKYDPWDLPKLSSMGEKEWYFYCLRDRKYRNSTRPNRVTGSGFWKATGTDRPIYSSDGAKCIGLKKSLVFYRGRAARGIKTDWMMHEFRLPSSTNGVLPKKILDQNLAPTESWAICRIFKKINSVANRALSHTWTGPMAETTLPDAFIYATLDSQFHPQTTEDDFQATKFSAPNIPSNKNVGLVAGKSSIFTPDQYFPGNTIFSQPEEVSATGNTTTTDHTCMLFNPSPAILECNTSESIDFRGPQQQLNGYYSVNPPHSMQPVINTEDGQVGSRNNQTTTNVDNPWENIRSIGFPFSLPSAEPGSWKPDLPWDYSPHCPSEISSDTYSTNKSYA